MPLETLALSTPTVIKICGLYCCRRFKTRAGLKIEPNENRKRDVNGVLWRAQSTRTSRAINLI